MEFEIGMRNLQTLKWTFGARGKANREICEFYICRFILNQQYIKKNTSQ